MSNAHVPLRRKKRSLLFDSFLVGSLLLGVSAVVAIYLASPTIDGLPEVQDRPRPVPEQFPDESETEPLPPLSYFEDITAASGVDFVCRNGEEAGHLTLLESLGSGVALIDYDGDGLLDIFLVGGGQFGGAGQ